MRVECQIENLKGVAKMGMMIKATSVEAKAYGCGDCTERKEYFIDKNKASCRAKYYECEHLKCPYFQSGKYEVEGKVYLKGENNE